MNNLIGITVDNCKSIFSVITVVPCNRNHTILLCIVANLLIIFSTADLILTVVIFLIDGTKLSNDHRISLGNKFGVHFFELGCHIRLIAPAWFLGCICDTVSPLGYSSGLSTTEIPWIIIMNRDHNSFLSGCDIRRKISICRHFKAVIPCRIINIGIPSRDQQPSLIVVAAGSAHSIHKNLIVRIYICIGTSAGGSVSSIKLLVHRLKDQMLVITFETIGNLLPACFVFCFNLCLVTTSAQQPSAVYCGVAVTVHIHNGIHIIVHTIIHHLLHTVKPCRINLVSVIVIDHAQIRYRNTD